MKLYYRKRLIELKCRKPKLSKYYLDRLENILNGKVIIKAGHFKSRSLGNKNIIEPEIQHLFCFNCLKKFKNRYQLFDHFEKCTNVVPGSGTCPECGQELTQRLKCHVLRHYTGREDRRRWLRAKNKQEPKYGQYLNKRDDGQFTCNLHVKDEYFGNFKKTKECGRVLENKTVPIWSHFSRFHKMKNIKHRCNGCDHIMLVHDLKGHRTSRHHKPGLVLKLLKKRCLPKSNKINLKSSTKAINNRKSKCHCGRINCKGDHKKKDLVAQLYEIKKKEFEDKYEFLVWAEACGYHDKEFIY